TFAVTTTDSCALAVPIACRVSLNGCGWTTAVVTETVRSPWPFPAAPSEPQAASRDIEKTRKTGSSRRERDIGRGMASGTPECNQPGVTKPLPSGLPGGCQPTLPAGVTLAGPD